MALRKPKNPFSPIWGQKGFSTIRKPGYANHASLMIEPISYSEDSVNDE